MFCACADPEEGQGVRTPVENHKNMGSFSNTGPDPSYQASIQCRAIIGPLAKRHLKAFRWWADDGPLLVSYGSSVTPSSTEKESEFDPL